LPAVALPEYCTYTGNDESVGPVREMVNTPTRFRRSKGLESSSAIGEVARMLTTVSGEFSLSMIVMVALA
jgi:hypothetical protein